MFFKIIQYSIISLFIIIIFHYLISHLTDNLTTPQVRDLVSSTNENYENIIKKIENNKNSGKKDSVETMKNDLKTYLNTLSNSGGSDSSLGVNQETFANQNLQYGISSQYNNTSNNTNTNTNTNNNTYGLNIEYQSTNNDELAYSTY
jgi:hypothetical protein